MGLSITSNITSEFNSNNGYIADMSGWDQIVIQFRSPSGTISITATNDDGSITGSVQGSALTAANFFTVQATKLEDGSSVTTVSTNGLYKVLNVGRFVKFGGSAAAATSVFIEYYKIS